MTKNEAIATAFLDAIRATTPAPVFSAFNAKLRECGYWIAPMMATGGMLKAAYATQDVWIALRDAFVSEEPK